MTGKDPNVFLSHARDCAAKVIKFAGEGKAVFLSDEKTHDAILRNLEIIGQCIKDAGVDRLAEQHPGIRWHAIAAFRNLLAHAYLTVKPDMVWAIVTEELPTLQTALNKILDKWEP